MAYIKFGDGYAIRQTTAWLAFRRTKTIETDFISPIAILPVACLVYSINLAGS